MQDFRHDPDPIFGQEYATILVAKWNLVNDEAYRADSVFWPAWAGGAYDQVGTLRPLSMAQNEAGGCPSGSNPACVSYQRFRLGYVWLASNGVASASFCPDVYPLPKGNGGWEPPTRNGYSASSIIRFMTGAATLTATGQ